MSQVFNLDLKFSECNFTTLAQHTQIKNLNLWEYQLLQVILSQKFILINFGLHLWNHQLIFSEEDFLVIKKGGEIGLSDTLATVRKQTEKVPIPGRKRNYNLNLKNVENKNLRRN